MKSLKIATCLLVFMIAGHAMADTNLYCSDEGGYWGAWITITANANNTRTVSLTYQYLSHDPSTAQNISATVQTPAGNPIDITTVNPSREAYLAADNSMLTLTGVSQNQIPMPCGPANP